MILRSWKFSDSIALVVKITRRSCGGNARNGVNRSHASSNTCADRGFARPSSDALNASRAARAAAAVGDLRADRPPELRALRVLHPDAQDVLDAVHLDDHGDIRGLVEPVPTIP